MTLDEICLANTPASFEPALDYVVTKMPRFPFDKFADAANTLSTQMKATGEVMSVGRTMEESLLKAVRSLEIGVDHLWMKKFDGWDGEKLLDYVSIGRDDRLFAIAAMLRLDVPVSAIAARTQIDKLFLDVLANIVAMERKLAAGLGVVNGTGNGSFAPEDDVTREDLAVMLYRYAEKMGYRLAQDGKYSSFADAANGKEVRFDYDQVYDKVTSNVVGRSTNVFTQLGMYWLLHLA